MPSNGNKQFWKLLGGLILALTLGCLKAPQPVLAATETHADIHLGTVSGRLEEKRTGKPLRGVLLELFFNSKVPWSAGGPRVMHTDREGNFRFPLVPIGDYQVAYQGRKYPVSEGFAGKVWIKGHGDLEDFAIEGITTKSPTTDGLKNCVVLRLKTRPTPDGCPVYAPPEASPPGTYIYRREDLEKLPGH